MVYYAAKTLQLAGLAAVGAALMIGLTKENGFVQEIGIAAFGLGIFYAGRMIEPR
jgi:hypothetical protein